MTGDRPNCLEDSVRLAAQGVHHSPTTRPEMRCGAPDSLGNRGFLRVGYFKDALPFAFVNEAPLIPFNTLLTQSLLTPRWRARSAWPANRRCEASRNRGWRE